MKTNTKSSIPVNFTHGGAKAEPSTAIKGLRRSVLTCLLWEDSFYENGVSIADRIASLVPQCKPLDVANLARQARTDMNLRHAPLYLLSELSKVKGAGSFVEGALYDCIQRADELSEFLAIYWKGGKRPLANAVKRGLAAAFGKFNEYQLAKYNQDGAVKLRDVMFLTHPKPKDQEQAELWKRLVNKELQTPDTWEVSLSGGADKRETFERLLREKKLGGLATLRNLRNMINSGVDSNLIRERLVNGVEKAFPYRFVTAAGYAPQFEPELEAGMLKALEGMQKLSGSTGILIDVSGSMDHKMSDKSESTRIDCAAGLAIMIRELSAGVTQVATFSDSVVGVPARRGFALRDGIVRSQPHSSTYLKKALEALSRSYEWKGLDRVIVITDEQSQDGISSAFAPKSYVINVASYQNGVGADQGWTKISGWSERVVDYIREVEACD